MVVLVWTLKMESLLIIAKEDTLKLNTQRVITNVIDLKMVRN